MSDDPALYPSSSPHEPRPAYVPLAPLTPAPEVVGAPSDLRRPDRRRGIGLTGTLLLAAAIAAAVGAFAGLAGYAVGRAVDNQASLESVRLPQTTAVIAREDDSTSAIAEQTLPAVVSILVEGPAQSGSGSGFVIRPDGYILTNNHVVDLASDSGTLTVVFSDGQRSRGRVVGTSQTYDLAVVKVDRRGLPTARLGDSAAVQVGDPAIAIGAPLGLDGTVTSGIISALDRPVTAGEGTADLSYINAIQTDAAINPGNSGGPLLDAAGTVIGINSAIASLASGGEASNIGLGFAIPINSAKRVAEELIATGRSSTPLMGVQLVMDYTGQGAKLKSVSSGSPAQAAGLRAGDIVRQVNGRNIDDAVELVVEVRNHAPGDELTITYERDGATSEATLTLGDDGEGG